jgi:hypothetical protein
LGVERAGPKEQNGSTFILLLDDVVQGLHPSNTNLSYADLLLWITIPGADSAGINSNRLSSIIVMSIIVMSRPLHRRQRLALFLVGTTSAVGFRSSLQRKISSRLLPTLRRRFLVFWTVDVDPS